MTKINEPLSNISEPNETFASPGENHAFYPLTKPTKNYSRRWKHTKPDLIKECFLCDQQIKVKYVLPRQAYSKKNLWGYWTKKPTDQNKYICNTCIVKILYTRRFNDWVPTELVNDFHTYLSRGSFDEKNT